MNWSLWIGITLGAVLGFSYGMIVGVQGRPFWPSLGAYTLGAVLAPAAAYAIHKIRERLS